MNLPDGLIEENEATYLAQLARGVAGLGGSFLEVGSWHGCSSVVIGMEVKKLNSRLYCIDIWNKKMTGKEETERMKVMEGYRKMHHVAGVFFKGDSYLIFTENIKARGLDDTIVPIIGFSSTIRKTWKIPLRFIFIDGNHDYKYIQDDCRWRQFLINAGIIAFHDYVKGCPVKRAVDETIGNDPDFKTIGSIKNIKAFRRMRK